MDPPAPQPTTARSTSSVSAYRRISSRCRWLVRVPSLGISQAEAFRSRTPAISRRLPPDHRPGQRRGTRTARVRRPQRSCSRADTPGRESRSQPTRSGARRKRCRHTASTGSRRGQRSGRASRLTPRPARPGSARADRPPQTSANARPNFSCASSSRKRRQSRQAWPSSGISAYRQPSVSCSASLPSMNCAMGTRGSLAWPRRRSHSAVAVASSPGVKNRKLAGFPSRASTTPAVTGSQCDDWSTGSKPGKRPPSAGRPGCAVTFPGARSPRAGPSRPPW